MKEIQPNISPLINNLFPDFYKSEGENFIKFVEAYYEWLEQNFQWMEMDDISGYSVGEMIYQEQDSDTLASGKIYGITDNHILVLLNTLNPFRCRTVCNVLADVIGENGFASKIKEQSSINPLFGARNIFKYRDVDSTIDRFIGNFKEKYLKNIQFNTATNKELLIKNSLDLYRSKGTERSVELFFKLIYNKNARVYYPGDDIFKLSSGDWFVPKYIEITKSDRAVDLVGKTIIGLTSGSSAFVEKLIKRKITTGYSHILFVSNPSGEFLRGESLRINDNIFFDAPKVIGSLNKLTVINPGSNYQVGDIVDVIDEIGRFGKARVVNTTTTTGEVEFIFYDGGYGYTTNPIKYVSDKIITISDLQSNSIQYFRDFENFRQKLSNIELSSANSSNFTQAEPVFSYYSNGMISAEGIVLTSSVSNIFDVTGDTSSNNTLKLNSGNTSSISVGDLVIGSTNTSVINTDMSSAITSIINSTAVEVNSSLVIANGQAYIAVSSDGIVGNLLVYVTNGEFSNIREVYTESNTVSASIKDIVDETVSAKIIKASDDLLLTVSNSIGTFEVGQTIYQTNGTVDFANGIIKEFNISGGEGSIVVSQYNGIFDTNYDVKIYESDGNCELENFTTTLAIKINNEKSVQVTVNTDVNDTSLLIFTTGNTSGIQSGDQILSSSNTQVVNTTINAFVNSVVNSTAITTDIDVIVSNGTSVLTFLDITNNDFISNSIVRAIADESGTSFIIDNMSLGSGADYDLIDVQTSEEVLINTDLISGNNVYGIPYLSVGLSDGSYGFHKNPNANSSSYLAEILDFNLLEIGSISGAITSNPGQSYTQAPIALVVEPAVRSLSLRDYVLTISEVPGTIKVGDTITQNVGDITKTIITVSNASGFYVGENLYQGANLSSSTSNGILYAVNNSLNTLTLINIQGTFSNSSNINSLVTNNSVAISTINTLPFTAEIAKGVVQDTIVEANSTTIYVSRRSVPSFVPSGNVIISSANVSANVISVIEQSDSLPIGLNANIEANVVISEGSVSELEVLDSGFGYQNNSIITFSGNSNQSNGTARTVVDGIGKSIGRYRDTNGFLSSDKYIFDGDYYQEYSYEVISAFSFDKYSDMFKKVMHAAGTKVFGGVEIQETGELQLKYDEASIDIAETISYTADNDEITSDTYNITADVT